MVNQREKITLAFFFPHILCCIFNFEAKKAYGQILCLVTSTSGWEGFGQKKMIAANQEENQTTHNPFFSHYFSVQLYSLILTWHSLLVHERAHT